MKIHLGKYWFAPKACNLLWHDWFAWYPVVVKLGDRRWLEWLNRRAVYMTSEYEDLDTWIYEYRELKKDQS